MTGRLISINVKALDAHLAHDDLEQWIPLDPLQRGLFGLIYGIRLPNVDCCWTE